MKRYLTFDEDFKIKTQLKSERENKSNKFPLVNYLNIGYYIITPLLFGVFLGYVVDKKLGTSYFVIIGIVIGALSTFYNLYRLTK